ncbi:zinc transporter 2-like [Dendronephthya gigantea]|uniref:zinc transporter 2-like n=1 Tax=Dendronephthya gigantea TaxID=151771 RepID=UPI00106A09EF|nr:zinc transporter 2-like [Dendronephthya gigantea]
MPSRKNEDEEPFIQLHEGAENITMNSMNLPDNMTELIHCHDLRLVTSNRKAWKKLIIASTLCFIFAVGEVVGGIYAGSLAIMTDAAHMFSDFGTFCISMFALYIAKKQANHKRTFGLYRAEILGAVLSVLVIWFLTAVLVYMAVHRIMQKEYNIDANIMIFTASFGVCVNVVLGCILHESGVAHSHGGMHSHHSADEKNINVRAAFIHVVGDTVQSIGVLIAALVIKFKPGWAVADPICTFLFSFLVLLTTIGILRDALHILCEGSPKSFDYFQVKSMLKDIPGVMMVHNLHIWSLNVDKHCLTAHLAIDLNIDSQDILQQALQLLKEQFRLFHITLQVETYQPAVMSSCPDCLTLNAPINS